MNSVTKYMNGHSDVIMGSLSLNDDKLNVRLRHLHNCKYHNIIIF
jgi:cystathionine beta-lyase/cystathionine gamma-synthase